MGRLKPFVLALLLASPALAGGEWKADRFFTNNGGFIDHISPFLVPPNKASLIQNFTLDDRGQLSARSGWTILNSTGVLTSTSAAVTGGGYHNEAASGTSFFSVIVGTNVYRTSNSFGGSYTNITSTVVITGTASNLAQHTALNDAMVFCNELDTPFKTTASGNAFALIGVSTGAKTCTTYNNYLVLGNTSENGTNFPSRIRWSDLNTVDSWPVLNFIDVDPNDGDRIVSIITFKDSIYIFKKRSIFRLLYTGLSGADAFIIRPFTRNMGCWAKDSVRVIPNLGIAFLSSNSIQVLGDNELSSFNYSQFEDIGDPIMNTLASVPRANWPLAVGAVYPRRHQYLLSISTSTSSAPELLAYDYAQKAWTIYTGMTLNMMDQAEDSTGANLLISGDFQGNNYKFDETSTQDQPANVNTAIPLSYTTGWLSQNQPDFTKAYKFLYVFTTNISTASLNVTAAFDYSVGFEYTNSIGLGTGTALYDSGIYDSDIYAQFNTAVTRFEINREAKAIKLNFNASSKTAATQLIGWTLVYQDEDFKQ